MIKKVLFAILIISTCGCAATSSKQSDPSGDQSTPESWSKKMAATAMKLWPDAPQKWSYDQGVMLKGIQGLWEQTAEGKYYDYIQHTIDPFIGDNGAIKSYEADKYKLDDINNGKLLLLLAQVTGKENYWEAATTLRDQLKSQPRTQEGGFWHKQIYTHQMWLDGLYMAEPFYAQYAKMAEEGDSAFDDIANQFILMEKHARDPKTGLLYHGWDESKQQRWADKTTGHSPNFWGRAMGWYAMALVDALDYFPKDNAHRQDLIDILNRLAAAVQKVQDPKTGVWYQVLNMPDKKGNYLEASASCMFVYALAKGVRKGYLPDAYMDVAKKGYDGIIKQFITTDDNGQVNLNGTCAVAGLGGHPYRDGSYQYYISEKPRQNDEKGVGAFMMASNEMALSETDQGAKGKNVVLDNYYNNEHTKNVTGHKVSYHYTWDDRANSGFWFFGHAFRSMGAKTSMLKDAPTAENLKNADVYIIADPDTKLETENPHYINAKDAQVIADWVKAGGTLIMMENDSINSEFAHFNILPEKFGMHYNQVSINHVQGHQYEQGAFTLPSGQDVFKAGRKVYMKEISTLEVKDPAKSIFTSNGNVIIAVAQYGKGKVFAVGDPWFYNEYTDGRKLPPNYENYQAGCDLVKWALK